MSPTTPLQPPVDSLSKPSAFIPLTAARQIPVGSQLDTTHGVVQLTTATASSGKFQSGEFGGGIFTVLQNRSGGGLTELAIVDTRSPDKVCATVSSVVLGRLNVDDHGKFTIPGQFSAATTVRGAVLSVVDRCDGTFTAVTRGEATVRDFVRRKTSTLFGGQSYLAASAQGALPSKPAASAASRRLPRDLRRG
jgi:hypothetical protein